MKFTLNKINIFEDLDYKAIHHVKHQKVWTVLKVLKGQNGS